MSKIQKLSFEDQELLFSLPYRVGMWISNVDDVESRKLDDKNEKKVLEIFLERVSKSGSRMPFSAMIAKKCISSKGSWVSWEAKSEEKVVFADLEKSFLVFKNELSPPELKQFKQLVWQCGITVAQAYDEDADPDGEMHMNHLFEVLGNMLGGGPKLKKAPENISAKEKAALKKLRDLLKQKVQ
ncbi:MAG: hypothetical protein AAF549_02700 [Pseudomonadota bacterium]